MAVMRQRLTTTEISFHIGSNNPMPLTCLGSSFGIITSVFDRALVGMTPV